MINQSGNDVPSNSGVVLEGNRSSIENQTFQNSMEMRENQEEEVMAPQTPNLPLQNSQEMTANPDLYRRICSNIPTELPMSNGKRHSLKYQNEAGIQDVVSTGVMSTGNIITRFEQEENNNSIFGSCKQTSRESNFQNAGMQSEQVINDHRSNSFNVLGGHVASNTRSFDQSHLPVSGINYQQPIYRSDIMPAQFPGMGSQINEPVSYNQKVTSNMYPNMGISTGSMHNRTNRDFPVFNQITTNEHKDFQSYGYVPRENLWNDHEMGNYYIQSESRSWIPRNNPTFSNGREEFHRDSPRSRQLNADYGT